MKRDERSREKIRQLVPDGYSRVRHVLTLALFTLCPIPLFIAALAMWGVSWSTFLALPAGFLVANFVEYMVHRWPMHRLGRWGKALYRRHAGTHHVVFRHDNMEIGDERDWYHVMMTPNKAGAFMFVIAAIVGTAHMLSTGSFAAMMGIALCTYFFLEEVIHLSFHLRSTWQGNRWYNRVLRRAATWHRIHHDTRLMRDVNFNISFPVFDILLGTLANTHTGDTTQEQVLSPVDVLT